MLTYDPSMKSENLGNAHFNAGYNIIDRIERRKSGSWRKAVRQLKRAEDHFKRGAACSPDASRRGTLTLLEEECASLARNVSVRYGIKNNPAATLG